MYISPRIIICAENIFHYLDQLLQQPPALSLKSLIHASHFSGCFDDLSQFMVNTKIEANNLIIEADDDDDDDSTWIWKSMASSPSLSRRC